MVKLGRVFSPILLLSLAAPLEPPRFDDAFWQHWGDGQAELSSYDLVYPRYGAERRGTAVAIFVTETFRTDRYVKAEGTRCCAAHEVPVLKLNLVEDFATGIYDYNLMTSTFVALGDTKVARAGRPLKVAFSAQEWCGQMYHQLRFAPGHVDSAWHSYFEGEADGRAEIAWDDGLSEDALWLWARGLAFPRVAPGERRDVPFITGLADRRLAHRDLRVTHAILTRSTKPESVTVPAGTFAVTRAQVDADGEQLVFWIENDPPHRVIRFAGRGREASLVGSARNKYWALNAPGGEKELAPLGLTPRPPRTP
jgi:hypothetical protein